MSNILYRIKNFGYKSGMRMLMPDLARQMEADGLLDLPVDGEAPRVEYMKVEDNGADITIFAFSGLDVLFAGLARYEFQGVLKKLGTHANFVFMRDVHRMGFQLKPDGSQGGAAFYKEEILRVKRELGASRNIAIGSSIGGSAAFAFGTATEMDELILFGAAFNFEGFAAPAMFWKCAGDMRKLFTEPRAYAELLIVTLAARWARKGFEARIGVENVSNPMQIYADAARKPAITLLYGETSWPDAEQAALLNGFARTRLVPLPTGRHNTPAFLKARGELVPRIAQALSEVPA